MPRYPQDPVIRRLFTKGQPLTYAKGDRILGYDPHPDGIYYISTGYAKLYSISDTGDEYVHIIYGPGELFPLVWAYLDIHSEALFYEAISDCVVWRISKEWFNHFVTTRAHIAYAVSVQMAQQFRVFSDRIDNLEYKKASERVAYRILLLASRFGIHDGKSILIEPPITHEIIANSINLARESVSRELEKLEHTGIIQRNGHQIRIDDIEKLAASISRPIDLSSWYT